MTRRLVKESHGRSYDAPISARAGDHGRLVRRNDEVSGWVWVEHEQTGLDGWSPISFLRADRKMRRVIFTRDDDASELSVAVGQVVSTGGDRRGMGLV